MNLHALKICYTVALTGSVTKAAEKLKISQPAITAQIKKFEKELDVPLFEAKGRGVALTAIGQKIMNPTKRLFALEGQIEAMVEEYRRHRGGKLRIVGTYLATSCLIPRWAAQFKSNHPEIEVQITTANTQDALEQLMNYGADIAICGGEPDSHSAEVEREELFRDEVWFVVAPDHKYANRHISFGQMMKEPFIMREEGSAIRERLFALCKTHLVSPPQVALQFSGLNETIHAVASGYGASFISSLAAREHVNRGELARVHVDEMLPVNTIALCTRRHQKYEAYVTEFISMIRRNLHGYAKGSQ
ncbi:LysR family transcriptional regulator [Paenibacillus melissococcoides]|uniref:LysR family transcriptional regulator n=1 Tax=Paenibacillus melissococcoides TaxID=2912268 RepID=A0ABM9G5M7_9BACL|nr:MULTISPECIES: LysR family transcriptional regulator [Paenibacillus]MEB9897809.1 LysR family transcriptional regulator [Bacillus cereus]CAH8246668.1 LysR family transcriptional regulator [Paenibacillus melissococcoides]CAH8715393.1 LysR family transcriptional regulator [Paenibacillus melissococcoides]CAH8716356.1 LysR family transcriptional regulator [Paenibacillus melissococcoides]GIO80043.1 LysR family transcriptional regulator [Paenibacillus dendritiformis]